MKVDVLFWFYKEFDICAERLERLRRLNPEIKVYALYGGAFEGSAAAQGAINELVDDFYAYPYEKSSHWKWKHGDQLIASWYKDRGKALEWETIFVMQWDMIILDPLEKLFRGLQPQEILLSGCRPLKEIVSWWPWANPKEKDLLLFKELLNSEYEYTGELFACLFIVACLPRVFLDKYVNIGHPEIGFLEYKIPTMASVFNIPICNKHDFDPWWKANPNTMNVPLRQRSLNAVGVQVPFFVIMQELVNSRGKRLFHPVFKKLPLWMENRSIVRVLVDIFNFICVFRAIELVCINTGRAKRYLIKQKRKLLGSA